MLAVLKCVAIGVAYVAPFYLRPGDARNSPSTIKFRMATTTATSLVAWLPLLWTLQQQARLRQALESGTEYCNRDLTSHVVQQL